MKFTVNLASLLAFVTVPVLGQTTAAYDAAFDNGAASLNTVACSRGPNGLESRGFTTFSSVPTFPNIGGAYNVEGFNSPACGTCWQLTYTGPAGVSKSINITAVDRAPANSFTLSLEALNTLTNNQGVALGRVPITAVRLPASACGL
ncbi:Cerato-platanin [Amanita rubescens]|nr:Cerato-platanin [Amanita rubescens]